MANFNFAFPDIPYIESREMYDYFFMLDRTLREMGKAINTLSNIDPEAIAKLVMPRADGVSIRDVDNVWTVIRAPFASTAAEADHADRADTATNADHADIADSAAKLSNVRTISLVGDTIGSVSFDGTTDVSISTQVSHSDTANKLSTARAITLTGDTTGSTSFDGSTDVLIATTTTHAKASDTASKATNAETAIKAQVADKLSSERRIELTGDVIGSTVFDGSKDVGIVTEVASTFKSTISDIVSIDYANKVAIPVKAATETYTMPGTGWLQVSAIGTAGTTQCIILSPPDIGGYGSSPYATFVPPVTGGGMGGLIKVKAGDSIVIRIIDANPNNREIWFIPEKGIGE